MLAFIGFTIIFIVTIIIFVVLQCYALSILLFIIIMGICYILYRYLEVYKHYAHNGWFFSATRRRDFLELLSFLFFRSDQLPITTWYCIILMLLLLLLLTTALSVSTRAIKIIIFLRWTFFFAEAPVCHVIRKYVTSYLFQEVVTVFVKIFSRLN